MKDNTQMISVFKNFYSLPSTLQSPEVDNIKRSSSEHFNDNKKSIVDFFPPGYERFYQNKEVINILRELYHGKCAYCERKADTGVDHYRPKSIYGWLIFEWSNLIPVCNECNIRKSNRFEIKGKPLKLIDVYNATASVNLASAPLLRQEIPLLIHPEVDTPENHIYYTKGALAVGRTDRGRYTVQLLDLNRSSLIQERSEILKRLTRSLLQLIIPFYFGPIKNGGQLFYERIPDQFVNYFRSLYELQSPDNAFSRLYQNVWEDLSMVTDELRYLLKSSPEQLLNVDDSYITRILNQLKIWQQLFLLMERSIDVNYKGSPRIVSFSIANFEGVRNALVRNLPVSAKWIFLTGENGFGKSSVLKGIGCGLIGKDLENIDARFKVEILTRSSLRERVRNIQYQEDEITAQSEQRFNLLEQVWQSDFFRTYPNVAAYGVNRTTFQRGLLSEINPLDNLFGVASELLSIESYLIELYTKPDLKNKFDIIVSVLMKVVPQLARIEIDNSTDLYQIKYYEFSDDKEHVFEEVPFDKLATGIKSVIIIVGDILCRMMLNRNIERPEDIEGIVLIDELDLHLHPKWQKELPALLSSAFPNIQFVASTHSPIPLLGAPEGSVFLRVQRTVEEGITIKRLKIMEQEIKNLLPNSVFTSDIFDFENIESAQNENIDDIHLEENFKEIEKNRKLGERLRGLDKSIFPDNLFTKG